MIKHKLFSVLSLILSTAVSALPADTVKQLRVQYQQPVSQWPAPTLDNGVEHRELGLLPIPVFPADNLLTAEELVLGEKLFHDPRLSRSDQIACANCHDRDLGWADGRRVSFGHSRVEGSRNAPSLENVAYLSSLFWDGRASSLEQQSLQPIADHREMNLPVDELIKKLQDIEEYQQLFGRAFGKNSITAANLAKALANYQRTLISRSSDFDNFLQAQQQTDARRKHLLDSQFSDLALWGLHLFRTKARCLNCHNGPEMTDGQFHNIGLTYYKRKYQDLGRYAVTKKPSDVGKFKTPGLRGVMNTKPWMHNGLFSSMEGVINIYNAGGVPTKPDPNDPLSPITDPLLQPLKLTSDERAALIAFLHAVTAPPATQPSVAILQQHKIRLDDLRNNE